MYLGLTQVRRILGPSPNAPSDPICPREPQEYDVGISVNNTAAAWKIEVVGDCRYIRPGFHHVVQFLLTPSKRTLESYLMHVFNW